MRELTPSLTRGDISKMLKREIPVHSHSGNFRITNASNKKYLAKDFSHRCAYCDDRDSLAGGYKSYHVEHFAPKEKFPALEFTYENLLYSCPFCNCSKNDDWVGSTANENVRGNCGYVSPCDADYQKHLDRNNQTGEIVPQTPLGKYMYDHLNLGLMRHSLIYMVETLQEKRNELQEVIEKERSQGKDVTKKEKLLVAVDNEFFGYYIKLQKELSA